MQVVIPFSEECPKTRLASVLSLEERRAFARAMLRDVIDSVRSTGAEPVILATDHLEADVAVTVDDGELSPATNRFIEASDDPVAIVMADLPLATSSSLSKLFDAAGDIIIAPGRGGGTNGLVVRHDEFEVDYHGLSYRDHRRNAVAVGASVSEADSFALATDIDEPDDLVEVLLHGWGEAPRWLREAGFTLRRTDGRVTVERDRTTTEVP